MSNIKKVFEKGKTLIPFITCGDPSIAITEELIYTMQKTGTDFIILGIPFSDPTAESDVVQSANLRALTNGITTDKIFDMVSKIRQNTNITIAFMTYANVVFSYGSEKFISKSAELGIDGLIITDLPFEEKVEFLPLCKEYDINIYDCKTSRWFYILRFFFWCDGNKLSYYHRYFGYYSTDKGITKYSLCYSFWHCYTTTGSRNSKTSRRYDYRFCYC